MTRFEVRDHRGAPTLFVDGEPTPLAIYLTVRNFDKRRDPEDWQDDPYFEAFRDVGFRFYSIHLPVRFDDAYDPTSGEFSLQAFAPLEKLRRYAALQPEARFLLRVYTEPRGKDSAWIQKHLEECEVLEPRAKGKTYLTPSYASRIWLEDAAEFIRTLVRYVYEHELDQYILGYLICAGNSAEWVKVGPMEDWAGDYSRPMQEAFRAWLCQKYDSDVHALREAWGDPTVSFEGDLVPSPEEQAATDLFLFKDPRKHRKAIDYFTFLAHLVASDIDFLCQAAKKACRGEHLAGVFYGYLQEIVWNNGFFAQGLPDADVAHTAAARSGHAGLREVLASPYVDFLSSPYSYGFRGVGGEGGFMSPEASVRLAGKLWVSEEDMRTHLWPPGSNYGQTRTTSETVSVLKRQMANLLTHGAGAWWNDWGRDRGGVFDDPRVMETFKRFLELAWHHLDLPDRSSAAEVATVIQAKNWFYRSTLNNLDIPIWRNRAWGIARLGAPVDCLLLDDLLTGRARDYKLYIFLNVFALSAAEREELKRLLRRDGKVALWVYAPGFVGEDGLSMEYCSDLVGIHLQMIERQWGIHVFINDFAHPLTRGLTTFTFWGTDMRLGPLFTVDDEKATVLGTAVTMQGRCEPGFALREETDWTSIYSAAPNLPPSLLREIARYAHVHLYSEGEDVLYADHAYVAIHTVRAGWKEIHLPRRADVWEVFTRRQVGRNCTAFRDWFNSGDTRFYYYGPLPPP
ncbi:MAG: hypothetical protein J7M05_13870 [Anaerolineae bacterium]|nr:hypothetical protein [Anaerolineae bacterium]